MVRRAATAGAGMFILCLAAHGAGTPASDDAIPWQRDYAKAQHLRETQGVPLLVFVTMDGCPYCEKMLATTFQDQQVRDHIRQAYLPTFINASQQQELARRFGVRLFPTTFLIAADNRIVERIEGFVSADAFGQRLRRVQHGERLARSPR